MITMNPVLLHGRSVWDQSYFPRDENEERLRAVQAEMIRRGLNALVVFGHHTGYEDLCYLTQYFPMLGWAVAVVPVEGEISVVAGLGGGRDLPAARARTWVQDVRNLPSLGDGLKGLLAEKQITGPIGLVGLDYSLPAALHEEVLASLRSFDCAPADDLIAGVRRSLRPREVSALRQSVRVIQTAAEGLASAHAAGASNTAAVVEAERTARRLGANDFRGLVALDESGELAPIEEMSPFRSEPMVAYLALNVLGYWVDLGITRGAAATPLLDLAQEALQAMMKAARPGVKAAQLARVAEDRLGPAHFSQAQRYGLGNGIGLNLCASPTVTLASDEVVAENSILTLRVRLKEDAGAGALASDLVLVKPTGTESLLHASESV